MHSGSNTCEFSTDFFFILEISPKITVSALHMERQSVKIDLKKMDKNLYTLVTKIVDTNYTV